MLISTAINEILRVVNNLNRRTEAFIWLQETLREIQSISRWRFTKTEKIHSWAQRFTLPPDFDAIIDPLFIDTAYTVSATELATADALGWMTPDASWEEEDCSQLRWQRGDYRVDLTTLTLHQEWTSGVLRLKYYRNITIPTSSSSTDAIDLPAEFVYPLIVYGASRHGLIGEDDYDRLKYAEIKFQATITRMKEKDGRDGIANVDQLAGGPANPSLPSYPFPSNYSIV